MDPDTVPTDAEISDGFDAAVAAVEPDASLPPIETPVEAPLPGTAEALDAERVAAEAADKTPEPATADAPAKAEPDKAVEDEITALGLKDKASQRFRELTAEVKELAPIKAQLEKAGVALDQLPKIIEHAKAAGDIVGMVMETGASAEQYGKSLDYLSLATKALAGDRAAAEEAFKLIGEEYAGLAKALGKDIPGIVDPLADHDDLLREVEDGELTRARALEIVQTRNVEALKTQAVTRRTEAQEQTSAQEQAIADGRAALMEFDRAMLAADPSYALRRDALSARVADMRLSTPPHLWASKAALLLATIPVPAPTPPPKPPVGPIRPGGFRPPLMPVTDDPAQALEYGIAAAGGG